MATNMTEGAGLTVATLVAPEDLKRGDFVTLFYEICELPTYLWGEMAAEHGPFVRTRNYTENAGLPLRVKGVCLPFVFVSTPTGPCVTLDVRRMQLARLDRRYAKLVWRELQKPASGLPAPGLPVVVP